MFFEEFEQQKNFLINYASQDVFGASWNDVSGPSKYPLQLARMVSCKNGFLCTTKGCYRT